MEQILQKLEQIPEWTEKFQLYIEKNNLSNSLVDRLHSQNIQSLSKHLIKLSQQNKEKHKISWVSSQYQALQIVLNSLSVISGKVIEQFVILILIKNSQQWEQIYAIFPYKVPLTIKYESLRIVMEKKQPRRRWIAFQENFLIEIVKQNFYYLRSFAKKNKWNDVARQLFIKSNGEFFRQGKHCRERWLNHLHPSIQKQAIFQISNGWTLNEDYKLLTFVLKKGKKWARIAKKFEMKRSQCMVKKRFFELIKVEEQENVSTQSLRSLIKMALQQIRSSVGERKEYQNQGLNQLQVNDQTYKKGGVSQQKLKINFPKKSFIQQKRSLETMEKSCSQQNSQEIIEQSCCQHQDMRGFQFQKGIQHQVETPSAFNYNMDYFGFINNMLNPIYSGYQPMMLPFQNNLFMGSPCYNTPQYNMY